MEDAQKQQVAVRFARASHSYDQQAVVQKQMAQRLVALASPFIKEHRQWFEFGCGTGVLTREILKRWHPLQFIANDLVDVNEPKLRELLSQYGCIDFEFRMGDIERLDMPAACDVVWSGATLQWIDDLPALFQKVAFALANDGCFVFSTFGPDNFHQVRAITGSGLVYPDLKTLQGFASVNFHPLVLNEWVETLLFDHPVEVLRHIKATGVGGVSASAWCKRHLHQFCDHYQQFYIPGQGYPLTYHPIVGVMKRKS